MIAIRTKLKIDMLTVYLNILLYELLFTQSAYMNYSLSPNSVQINLIFTKTNKRMILIETEFHIAFFQAKLMESHPWLGPSTSASLAGISCIDDLLVH